MSLADSATCPRCGASIQTTVGGEFCPACLLSGALDSPRGETVPVETGSVCSTAIPEFTGFPRDFGGYRLLGLLGRGGMGTVYEAEHVATGRRVALKMLGQQLDSPDMRQRFLREGRLAARVNHPNSLYIFGSEEIEGCPVITMEIVGGGTLKDRLKQRGPFPIAEAVDAILDIISGLESALAGGVLHRDVKPSNCFVCPDGSVKVGDFGLSVSTLAKTDTFVTAHGKVLGTPAYASPEQLRGDTLDVRADIYSVGATLFTLLTDRAPFEGDNAVQVVANAVNQKPKPLTEFRDGVPPDLERVVARCLAKEPERRYADYAALRNALLPFGSNEPEPASMKRRAAAGWIDYLIAFHVPYLVIMFSAGAAKFHLQPLVERTLFSARYYFLFLAFGFLYFGLVEGLWGGGLGKRLMGLRVVRANGRAPGFARALARILVPIACIEGIRVPFLLATISVSDVNQFTGTQVLLYIGATNVCPWIAVLLTLGARRENGFATLWDWVTGTQVVVMPTGAVRSTVEPLIQGEPQVENSELLGPYQVQSQWVPGTWIVATDPVLRRQVWLFRRDSSGPSLTRRNLARAGRLRWLQRVETAEATWDAFEAPKGRPFSAQVEGETLVPWVTLRHWLHDLASELWEATGDQTLPAQLSLDHVWITAQGHAILLDEPMPGVRVPAQRIPVGDVMGQQRFLSAIAACVETTSLPLHARPVLRNLAEGRFEKLSYLTGTLRGLLNKPAEVSRGIRAGSIFMLPLYVWILVVVGSFRSEEGEAWIEKLGELIVFPALGVLGILALVQLLELPFRTTVGHSIFRLAVVSADGSPARRRDLLIRWAVVWLPLILPLLLVGVLVPNHASTVGFAATLMVLLLWLSAAVYAALHPTRGLHDRLAGNWVVRR